MMGKSTCMCECLSASWVDIFPLDVFWIFKNDLAPQFYLLLCNDDQRVYAIKIYSNASIERIIMIASLHMSLMIYHLFMNIINLNTININCSCSMQATLLFSVFSLLLISIQVVLVSKSVLHICIKRQLMHAWLSVAAFFIERILETTLHLQTDATSYVKINKNLSACRLLNIFNHIVWNTISNE